jgi:hypothetical protein
LRKLASCPEVGFVGYAELVPEKFEALTEESIDVASIFSALELY